MPKRPAGSRSAPTASRRRSAAAAASWTTTGSRRCFMTMTTHEVRPRRLRRALLGPPLPAHAESRAGTIARAVMHKLRRLWKWVLGMAADNQRVAILLRGRQCTGKTEVARILLAGNEPVSLDDGKYEQLQVS